MSPRKVVLGLGHPFRGDDGIGGLIARELASKVDSGVLVRAMHGGAAELLEAWQGSELAVVVDAVNSGAKPGSLWRWDLQEGSLPAVFQGGSSHALGLAEAVALGQVLDQLPGRLIVHGIEADQFQEGAPISPSLLAVVDEVVERVLADLETA
ncbi:MAG: hydrogenase maturation protease [Planctomycetota bacterium]|nr:MAG: hydrogenase maturation protease [Planctomycetota bacterium]